MSDYPKLPEGCVYLGKGGTFKKLPAGRYFVGCTCYENHDWRYSGDLYGDKCTLHFCAPADSEIVKLNTPTVDKPPGFIVWSPARGETTKVHTTRFEADAEAQRLAGKHPTAIFCVCEITARYQATVSVKKL